MKKILVVGAGISGIVIARKLADKGYLVDIIDKRDHIGGNCYDYVNEHGILVHRYGPHLFHTNNEKVFSYLSNFTDWVEYKHRVKALLKDGTYVPFPINNETKKKVKECELLDTFFRPYTRKMWGVDIEELNTNILKRVPSRDDECDLYFPNDKYQVMPKNGYTEMFNTMLQHENITYSRLEFEKSIEKDYEFIFNSMPIEEYFEYCFGELDYRSIKFHTIHIPSPLLIPVATINFTHDGIFTRMTEWQQISNSCRNDKMTTITYEEPCSYIENDYERYYPINDREGKNKLIYNKYADLMKSKKNMKFIGRCGKYSYLDMDKAVMHAFEDVTEFLKNKK